ncbi:hypothetical protein B7755_025115 [Streptomyces sp. NBS 14/10]|uniref:hypothetical protein n=1 Tax=Streptomyces sp. NBS 14/10 TaxID=1945643 RepID=UPI0015C6400D|nr:hypothetical protein [Streptomyces sp. NBS 14/10]KAK1181129.1 hypothetical protein B7755_025115 [Streptomyces sp. NBS 14/10]
MATTMVREAGVAPWSTVEEGVEAVLHLLAAPARGVPSGRYFNGTEESRADAQAYDARARRRLRELSEDLVVRALAPGAYVSELPDGPALNLPCLRSGPPSCWSSKATPSDLGER